MKPMTTFNLLIFIIYNTLSIIPVAHAKDAPSQLYINIIYRPTLPPDLQPVVTRIKQQLQNQPNCAAKTPIEVSASNSNQVLYRPASKN